jgi:hypothetical protein
MIGLLRLFAGASMMLLTFGTASYAQVNPVLCSLLSGVGKQACIMAATIETGGGTITGDWMIPKPRVDRLSKDFSYTAITMAHDHWEALQRDDAPYIGFRCTPSGTSINFLGTPIPDHATVKYAFGSGPIESVTLESDGQFMKKLPAASVKPFYEELISGQPLVLRIEGMPFGEMKFGLKGSKEVLPEIASKCGL